MTTPIWTPPQARVAAAGLSRFADFAAARHGAPPRRGAPAADYEALWRWSTDQRAALREALLEYAEVIGERGELVCTRAFPSLPLGFWNDADGAHYRAEYFERFPGVWHHGNFAVLTEHGGLVILGRPDAVLNPGGVRIGTADIYRPVEKLDEVLESVAIGQDWDNDVRVVLFVRLRPGVALDATLEQHTRATIRANTTRRHVPAKIVAVGDIPRTLSGKIVELAIRNAVHGRPVTHTDALANPAALAHFRDRPELARE